MTQDRKDTRDGGKAIIIIQHCAVRGEIKTPVNKFKVYNLEREAIVGFVKPRRRNWVFVAIKPIDVCFLTIESEDGAVLYDSRTDVSCDATTELQ